MRHVQCSAGKLVECGQVTGPRLEADQGATPALDVRGPLCDLSAGLFVRIREIHTATHAQTAQTDHPDV